MKKLVCILMALVCVALLCGCDFDYDYEPSETKAETEAKTEAKTEPSKQYIVCTVSQLVAELDANAMNAKEKYEGEYVEVTGRVDVIDASGSYICLYPADDEWAFTSVQCFVKNKKQKEFVRTISTGDIVTVRGKMTSVGEILGFTMNIEEFVE